MGPEGGGDAEYLAAEARARVEIDRMLGEAGWAVQGIKVSDAPSENGSAEQFPQVETRRGIPCGRAG